MKKKILLVDNNKAIAFLVGTLLKQNYATLPVLNSRYAMKELFNGQAFDLIIINIESIDSDNFRLMQHISTSSLLNSIPIVALSGCESTGLKKACEQTGRVSFIPKPFDPISFIQKIDALTEVNTTAHNEGSFFQHFLN